MKKSLLKLLMLSLMLTVSALANAEPIEIYLLKSTAYPTTKIHVWDTESDQAWPGVAMETVDLNGEEFFYWKDPEGRSSINIIFNNDNKGLQTNDITGVTETTYYKLNSNTDSRTGVTTFNPLVLNNPTITEKQNTVTITKEDSKGEVYYTLNGDEPTAESQMYTEPFELNADATVKAIQINGTAKSEVVTFDFTWNYYVALTATPGIYCVGTAEAAPEVCFTDMPYVPDETQSKVSGQPDVLYLLGNLMDAEGNKHHWVPNYEFKAKRYGSCFVFESVILGGLDDGSAYFSFSTRLGDWNNDVNKYTRYGAESSDAPITEDVAIAFTTYASNPYDSKAWKFKEGTYDIIVDFSTGQVTVTRKARPEFKAMAAAEVEGMKATEGILYATAPDATSAKAYIRANGSLVDIKSTDAAKAYILSNNALVEIEPVTVGVFGAANSVITDDTYFMASAGATAFYINEKKAESTKYEFSGTAYPNNDLVTVNWSADNAQGLTFFGSQKLVNAVDDVVVRARTPEGWTGMAYRIVSDIDDSVIEEGVFSVFVDTYYELLVPSHLIHSTITISNPATPSQRAKASAESYTYKLDGKSKYFDNNGEHWSETEYDWGQTGIEAIDAADEAVEYFNLQGVRVAEPTAGIYLRRQGAKVAKVIVK